jgi:hypothetical protein
VCVCVCSILYSYACQVVSDRPIIRRSADLGEALQPQARALRTGAFRNQIIPCRFNHCRNAISLTNQIATMSDLCLDCTIRSRNGSFCDLSQPFETMGDAGRASGPAPGTKVSHTMRKRLWEYHHNSLVHFNAARHANPTDRRPRRGDLRSGDCRRPAPDRERSLASRIVRQHASVTRD